MNFAKQIKHNFSDIKLRQSILAARAFLTAGIRAFFAIRRVKNKMILSQEYRKRMLERRRGFWYTYTDASEQFRYAFSAQTVKRGFRLRECREF